MNEKKKDDEEDGEDGEEYDDDGEDEDINQFKKNIQSIREPRFSIIF